MEFEYDPVKDRSNLGKHGLSLGLARLLDWDAALVWVDDRIDYGKARMIALAPVDGVLYCIAFVDRDEARRVISLRKANRREVTRYVHSD